MDTASGIATAIWSDSRLLHLSTYVDPRTDATLTHCTVLRTLIFKLWKFVKAYSFAVSLKGKLMLEAELFNKMSLFLVTGYKNIWEANKSKTTTKACVISI